MMCKSHCRRKSSGARQNWNSKRGDGQTQAGAGSLALMTMTAGLTLVYELVADVNHEQTAKDPNSGDFYPERVEEGSSSKGEDSDQSEGHEYALERDGAGLCWGLSPRQTHEHRGVRDRVHYGEEGEEGLGGDRVQIGHAARTLTRGCGLVHPSRGHRCPELPRCATRGSNEELGKIGRLGEAESRRYDLDRYVRVRELSSGLESNQSIKVLLGRVTEQGATGAPQRSGRHVDMLGMPSYVAVLTEVIDSRSLEVSHPANPVRTLACGGVRSRMRKLSK